MLKMFRTLVVIASFSSVLTACVTTASINNDAASNYAKVKQQAQAQNAVDTTSDTARRIHSVFNQMKPYAEKANQTGVPFQWEITVLKSKELNAWAMPGGKMAFYTGLVDTLNLSNDEIAVVMGHEMAHALEEHGKSDQTFSTVTSVLAQVGTIALQTQGIQTNYGGVDLVGTLADLGLNKPFSRSQETEADEVGLMLMAEAGFNPEAAPNVWVKMAKANGSSGEGLASLISTHPSNASRQENLARLVPKAKAIYQARQK